MENLVQIIRSLHIALHLFLATAFVFCGVSQADTKGFVSCKEVVVYKEAPNFAGDRTLLGRLSKNTSVSISEESNGEYLVNGGGLHGYVETYCVTHGTPTPASLTADIKKTVQEAQQQLQVLGYPVGSVDGVMGAKAIAVLRKFQSDHGLPVTGQLDRKTLDALNVQTKKLEEEQWNRALKLDSVDAYLNYYKQFPDTWRLAVLQGTLEAEIVGRLGENGFQNEVLVRMNGSDVCTISVAEAMKWNIVARKPVVSGVDQVSQRAPIPNARIVMLKGPDKIVSIDTNAKVDSGER